MVTSIITSLNNSANQTNLEKKWLFSLLVLLSLLFVGLNNELNAQCTLAPDHVTTPQPYQISISLSPGASSAFVDELFMNSQGVFVGDTPPPMPTSCNMYLEDPAVPGVLHEFVGGPPASIIEITCLPGPHTAPTFPPGVYNIYGDNDGTIDGAFTVGPLVVEFTLVDVTPPTITSGDGPDCMETVTLETDKDYIYTTAALSSGVSVSYDCRSAMTWRTPTFDDNCQVDSLAICFRGTSSPAPDQLPMSIHYGPNTTPVPASPFIVPSNYFYGASTACSATTRVTYKVWDASGNVDSCWFDVVVEDNEDPTWDNPLTGLASSLMDEEAISGFEDYDPTPGGMGKQVRVVLDCNSPHYSADSAYLASWMPTASDNCDLMVAVAQNHQTANAEACVTRLGVDNIYARFAHFFTAEDNCAPPNALDHDVLPNDMDGDDERFRLVVLTADNTSPYLDPDSTGVMAPVPVMQTGTDDALRYVGTDTVKFFVGPGATDCDYTITDDTLKVLAIDCQAVTYDWSVEKSVDQFGNPTGLAGSSCSVGFDPSCMDITNEIATWPIGTHDIRYFAMDACGLTTWYDFVLQICDTIPPQIVDCPPAAAVNDTICVPANAGLCETTVGWIIPSGLDCSGIGSVTGTATDPLGNPITVFTGNVPAITCADEFNFVGNFDPLNWYINNNGGSGSASFSGIPATTLDMTSNGFLGPDMEVNYLSVPFDGVIEFSYTRPLIGLFSFTDLGYYTDALGYVSLSGTSLVSYANGTVQVPVVAGERFAFILTAGFGVGTATINNFSFHCKQGAYADFPVGVSCVEYIIEDNLGNADTCKFYVKVFDDQAPTAICQDVTIQLDHTGTATLTPAQINNGSNDNCPGPLTYSFVDPAHSSFDCGDVGANMVQLIVMDAAGNPDTCDAMVTVEDNIPPSILCPGDTILYADADCIVEIGDYRALADTSDNCVGLTVTQSPAPNTTLSGHLDQIAVTLTVTDPGGLTDACVFTVSLRDTTHPVITNCPADITVYADANCTSKAAWTYPTFSDNCGALYDTTASAISGVTDFSLGTTVVLYTIHDGANNESSCSFNVTVVDTLNPVFLSCTPPFTINSICPDTEVPSVNNDPHDNCGIASVVQTPTAGTKLKDVPGLALADGEMFTIMQVVTDNFGNTDTCRTTVTIMDGDAPVPVVHPLVDTTYTCGTLVLTAPTAKLCDGTTVYGVPSAFSAYLGANMWQFDPGFFAPVLWTYTHPTNFSTSTQTQLITVTDDNIAPAIECPGIIPANDTLVVSTDAGLCSAVVNGLGMIDVSPAHSGVYPPLNPGEYIDNCEVDTFYYQLSGATTGSAAGDADGLAFNEGVTKVSYIVIDNGGLSDTCMFWIKVDDNENPAAPNADLLLLTGDGADTDTLDCAYTVSIDSTNLDPIPMDNCAMPPAKKIISWVAFGTASIDIAAPDSSTWAGSTFHLDPTRTFNFYFITWQFDDGNGNKVTFLQTIRVDDGQAPWTTCPTDEDPATPGIQATRGVLDDGFGGPPCEYIIQGPEFDATATDNCGVVRHELWINGILQAASLTPLTAAGISLTLGNHTLEWRFYDNYGLLIGRYGSCIIDVEIEDDEAPVIACNPTVVPLPSTGTLLLDYEAPFGSAAWFATRALLNNQTPFDACTGIDTVIFTPDTWTCASQLNTPTPITITVWDGAGNQTSCNTTIEVQENIPPVAMCIDTTLYLDASGNASISGMALGGASTDNCASSLIITANPSSFDCSQAGTSVPVTVTVSDGRNIDVCVSMVTVLDTLAPSALAQTANVYLDASGNATVANGAAGALAFDGGSTDNCGIDTSSMSISPNSFDCSHIGPNPVVFTVSDNNGNSATANAIAMVLDTVAPTVHCQDITLSVDPDTSFMYPASMFNAGSTDACGIESFQIAGGDSIMINCENFGSNPVTVTVSDTSGNTATCTANLTVMPDDTVKFTAGTVTGPAGATIEIPVTVEYFRKVNSFQFTVDVVDPLVATLDTVYSHSLMAPMVVQAGPGNARAVNWNAQVVGPVNYEDLNDGDTAFVIVVTLVGASGQMSDILLDGSTITTQLTQGCGVVVVTALNLCPGKVTVGANTSSLIDGYIWREGSAVGNVTVIMTGDVSGTVVTGPTGYYSFNVPNGSNVTITPTKDINVRNGVFANDAAEIRNHVASFVGTIPGPYRLLAGDVDDSNGAIPPEPNVGDAGIIQDLIALNIPDFKMWGLDSWIFVPSSFTFTNINFPWFDNPLPGSVSLTNVTSYQRNDFEGMKMGDVTADADPLNVNSNDPASGRSAGTLYLAIDDRPIVKGETYTIDFKARDFASMRAFQMTLDFDAARLAYVESVQQNLVNLVFGESQLADGHLAAVWSMATSQQLGDGDVLFSLRFRALKDADKLSDLLAISDAMTPSFGFDSNLDAMDIELEFNTTTSVSPVAASTFALHQNRPNPFKAMTVISFQLPEAGLAKLNIHDVSGKLVYEYEGDFVQGYNEVTIERKNLPNAGVLYYQLQAEDNTAIRKMILIE